MFTKVALVTALAVGGAIAQRPENTTMCDYYTTALLKNNTATNQKTLLTLLVNTVVVGNYSEVNTGTAVPGILAAGEVNGTAVNLLPYFSGGLASTNTGEMAGRSVNFLDGGGAAPLLKSLPADEDKMDSRQASLLNHLYQYFGSLLGCGMRGSDFPEYQGAASQYDVHKFMALSNAEVTYFITQVALAARSFGVTEADITAVGTALSTTFGYRCSPETAVIPAQGPQLQAICIDEDCPIAPENPTCDAYAAVVQPQNATTNGTATTTGSGTATGTATRTSGTGTATGTAAGTGASTVPSGGATVMGASFVAVAAGVFAALL